ncbi:phosphotransferase [Promicromonospora soli]|uniref:Aminoglycoside phosphotransferase domain-containing protein n=1 Tax=Promicromonospora soli TaxID=2035533 RepID=A0A919FH07_9MICO|nr:phosphotransferase [Promicromonospora soli]GHH65154.1 hypothetical protein GCM10017772_02880 [Promicromonospora soli]
MVAADLDVTVDLARSLLEEQHPDLADRPLQLVANGWDNVMIRLGDDLALRLPRRELGAQLMRNEHQVLPLLAPRLPVAVPDPVRTGVPSPALGYPWPWGVVRWADGVAAATVPATERTPWAEHLARFFVALHQPATDDGRLSAVIDFGDVTSGDPASDLGTMWLTFDAEGRKRFRRVVDAEARDGRGWDTGMWRRAQGWALLYTTICFSYPDTHPIMVRVGEHAVEQLFSEGA